MDEQEALLESLLRLTTEQGVYQPNLYVRIGKELRGRWAIFQCDETSEPGITELAIFQLGRLIDLHCDDEAKQVLRVAYNLDAKEKQKNSTLQARLNDAGISPNWLYRKEDDSGRTGVRNAEIPLFARSLIHDPPTREELAEHVWHKFEVRIPIHDPSADRRTDTGPQDTSNHKWNLGLLDRLTSNRRSLTLLAGLVVLVTLVATSGTWWPSRNSKGSADRGSATASPPLAGTITVRRSHKKIKTDSEPNSGWALPNPYGPQLLSLADIKYADTHATPNSDYSAAIQRFDDWIYSNNGATVGATHLRVTLTAAKENVLVQNICAHIVQRDPLLTGTLFFKGTQGEPTIKAAINLDSSESCGDYFEGEYLMVRPGNSLAVDITAVARRSTVTWELYAEAVVGGNRVTIPVDPTKRLRTTGLLPDATRYQQYYRYDNSVSGGIFSPRIMDTGESDDLQRDLYEK